MTRENITLADSWFIGEDQSFAYQIYDDASNPRPVDLTGMTILFELSDIFSGDSLFIITCSVTNGPQGLVEWIVGASDTVSLTGDADYWYTLRRTDVGSRTELAWGTARLNDVFVNY